MFLTMEQKIRQAERRGDMVALVEHEITAGIYFVYDKPLGPLALWEAECAIEGCSNHLEYSNCSFCDFHHGRDNGCVVGGFADPIYPEERIESNRYAYLGPKINGVPNLMRGYVGASCNYKREERMNNE